VIGVSRDPLWKSFLKALALLSIAMIGALIASSTASAGDVTTTLVAAFVSMVLAVWVGIRYVPRLARSVNWTWTPAFTKYRPTREGGIFFCALLTVLLAAVNTSNNLLYMVLSALLAVLLLSGMLSSRNFRGLEMDLFLPERAFAGDAVSVTLRIRNRRRILPATSLHVVAPGGSLYFPVIQPGGILQRHSEIRFPRRGRHVFENLLTASCFPFGFFLKAREFDVNAECICYPEIRPQDQLDVSIADLMGSHRRLERGIGIDLHTIRDYVPSDSARHVHWKATAKTAALKTREFAAEDSRLIVLALDRHGYEQDADSFEDLVSRAASLAFHLIHRGVGVTFISDEWESSSEASETNLTAILNYLALVEMSGGASPPPLNSERGAVLFSLRRRIESGVLT
jgi:uncharacterized protein (DUF58 family)